MSKRLLFGVGAVVVVVLAFLAYAWQPALAPVDSPAPSSFPRDLVERGAVLASAGNCAACHTAPGGAAYAGGNFLRTPFGSVPSTNITPDPETGIGRWSEAAFARALRRGVARDGHHLFPVFPFDHFAKLTDADIQALYAYFMTVPPKSAPRASNTLVFPFDVRALQALWQLLYLDKKPYQPDPAKSAEWNRGAYLVEGLAHCGACHTPRNILGAEQVGHPLAGALTAAWYAPPLDVSPSPARWTRQDLERYLRGASTVHGRAIGPMAEVVESLHKLPDSDIAAIAVYILDSNRTASSIPEQLVTRALAASIPRPGRERDREARLYLGACGQCHDSGGSTPLGARSELGLSTALWSPQPHNLIRVVLDGIGEGEGALMPPFRHVLSDDDVADIAAHLRRSRTSLPPWPLMSDAVKSVRKDPFSLKPYP